MTEEELKAAFAAFFMETENAFEAALKLYPAEKDRGEACRIAFAWPSDPFVIVELERLKKDGAKNEKIPSKEDVIAQMWILTQHNGVAPKDRVAMARLIADMLGFIAKPTDSDTESKRMPTAPVYKVVNE